MKKRKINNIENNIKVFRTVKVPLKKVLKHYDIIQPKLEETILRVNNFTIRTYEFIKLFCLEQFENNKPIPEINKKFIKKIFSLIGKGSNKGKKVKTNSNDNDDLEVFYYTKFSKIYNEKLNSIHLSYILPILADEIIKCFETNIKTHFIKYINKFINVVIRAPLVLEIKQSGLKRADRKLFYTELNSVIKNIKEDLINLKCEKSFVIFHDWIKSQIKTKFNFKIEKSLAYDVKVSPQKYIIPAILLNKEIENLGKKAYQVFCQRSNIVPKMVCFNTSSIVETINDKNKEIFKIGYSEMCNNTKKYQNHCWRSVLKLETKSIFNQKQYIYYNQLLTDGISCSLLFIHKDYYNKTYGQKVPEYDEDIDLMIKELEDLTKEECIKYQNKNLVAIDPGKAKILTMIDENNNIYSYSNCRRRFETYTKRSNQITLNEKNENDIIELETELSKFNKRTLYGNKFIDFLNEKNKHFNRLQNFYEQPLFRKLSLRRY